MPRPTTKEQLIQASTEQYNKLWNLISNMPLEDQIAQFQFDDRDKNIKDILAHLYEWHQLLLNWTKSSLNGISESFLPKPYNWKTYPDMNVEFWKKHQTTSYAESQEMFKNSHIEVMKLIDTFSDDELFMKKYFPWTGTTSLGSYCVSATSSHYDWAIKKIKNHIKTLKESRS